MTYIEYPPEVRALSDKAILESVVPNWVERVGGPSAPIVDVFNKKIGTIVDLRVEPDGSVVRTN